MSILSDFRSTISALGQRMASLAVGSTGTVISFLNHKDSTRRGTEELLASYRVSPWFRSVVNRIAFSVAAVPWRLYAVTGSNGRAQKYSAIQHCGDPTTRQKLLLDMEAAGRLKEIPAHPMLDLLNRPNPDMTGLNARRLTQTYLDIPGEVFWILERNAAGRPIEYRPIPPTWMTRTPSDRNGFKFEANINGQKKDYDQEDVIWMRELNVENPWGRGTGIGESLGDEIETDEYAAKHVKSWFENKAKPELLIGVEGAKQAQLVEAKERFEQQHRGWLRAHRSFWHGGKITVKELQQTFSDMQLMDLRKHERDSFVNVYNVPPEIMGIIENSNRATIDSAMFLFAVLVLVPRLEFQREELQTKLVPMYDDRLILGYESPVPEDKEFQLNVMKSAPHTITQGEWRRRSGLVDRGTGDDVQYIPINLVSEPAPRPSTKQLKAEQHGQKRLQLVEAEKKTADVVKVTDRDIELVLQKLRPQHLVDAYVPVQKDQMKEWGDRVLDELGVDVSFDLLNPLVVDHLSDMVTNRIKNIDITTAKDLRAQLIEGVKLGEGSDELAKRVGNVFEVARGSRARMIARTEVVRTSNFSSWQAYAMSGVVDLKQWLDTPDDRTREEHIELGSKDPIPLDDPFVIGGEQAMYPGGFGVPELDIQCRCAISPVIRKPKNADERLVAWKVFDRKRTPWEKALLRAVQRAFRAQERDIKEELAKLKSAA